MISWGNYATNPEALNVTIGLTTVASDPLLLPFLGGLGQTADVIEPDGFSLNSYFELEGNYPIACVGFLGVESARAVAFDVSSVVEYGMLSIDSGKHEQLIIGLSDIIIPTPFDEGRDYAPIEAMNATMSIKNLVESAPISIAQYWAAPGVRCAARFTMTRGAGSQAQLDRGHSGAIYSSGTKSWREYDVELICHTMHQWYRPGGLWELQRLGLGTECVILPTGGPTGTPQSELGPQYTPRGRETLALHGRISSPVVATQMAAAENYTRVTFRVEECL